MNNDLDLIVKEYPRELPVLRVYAIGDVHVGSPQFNEEAIRKKIKIVQEDECGVAVICGDLGDYGLKNSLTNVYLATLQPREQQEFIYELFKPIAHKITACVPGNHEERLVKEGGGINPLLSLCCRWGIEDVYRENVAITKYVFGKQAGRSQQNSFIGITSHGSSRNKHRKFSVCFEHYDFFCSGHSHQPEYSPRGRIRINPHKNTAAWVSTKELIVDGHLKPSGYGLKKEYEVAPPPELQYFELSSYRENNSARTLHKVINYHSIQL